jgi:hypothetical protein
MLVELENHKFVLARAIDLQIEMLGEVANLKLNSYLTIGDMLTMAKDFLIGYKTIWISDCIRYIEKAKHKLGDNVGSQGVTFEHYLNTIDLETRLIKEAKHLGFRFVYSD